MMQNKNLILAMKLLEKNQSFQAQSVIWSYRALRFLLMASANPQIVNRKSEIGN